jgi:transcriptional/translational regulatory protein YebC/TACO1
MVYTSFEDFGNMQKKLEEIEVEPQNAELQRMPNNTKTLDIDSSKKILKLVDLFEEDEDVQNVYHNLEITEELLNEI